MTEAQLARRGRQTDALLEVAATEHIDSALLMERVAAGFAVILKPPPVGAAKPVGIGFGLSTKINANVGTSSASRSQSAAIAKARAAAAAGADMLMDLSSCGELVALRQHIMKGTGLPLGTVPVYELASQLTRGGSTIADADEDAFVDQITSHAREGCSTVTIHPGLTLELLKSISSANRLIPITSRGGMIIAQWMQAGDRENPFLGRFDEILEVAEEHDVVLGLGSALRAGCVRDGGDELHIRELTVLSRLASRAISAGVQVRVEGPGHLKLSEIPCFIRFAKQLCHSTPFGVLGPMVTDVGLGSDHVTHAIGLATALLAGADYASAVYPTEHVGLPDLEDIEPGIAAARIAAHSADICKLAGEAQRRDDEIAVARMARDWNAQESLAISPALASAMRDRVGHGGTECSMCGDQCPLRKQVPYA